MRGQEAALRITSVFDLPARRAHHEPLNEVALDAARRGNDWLQLAMESGSMVLWEIREDRSIRYSGPPTVLARMGFVGGRVVSTLEERYAQIDPADADRMRNAIETTLATGAPYEIEYRVSGADGDRWLMARGRRVAGKQVMRGVIVDVTERKLREQALRSAEELFRTAFSFAPIGIGLRNGNGEWLRVNPALCRLLGRREIDLLGSNFLHVIHPDDRELHVEMEAQLLAGRRDSYRLEKRFRHASGHTVWVRVNVSAVRAGAMPLYLISQFEDITESVLHEQELHRLSLIDDLTGLHNRRSLMTLGEHMRAAAARTGSSLGILFLDLDGFKAINDDLGHARGDAALQDFAELLRNVFRQSDVIARVGGDEFCIVQADADEASVLRSAERLEEAIDVRLGAHGGFGLRVSAGIAILDARSSETLETAIERADQAMYVDKRQGRDEVRTRRRGRSVRSAPGRV